MKLKILIASCFLTLSVAAHAGDDKWTNGDKRAHLTSGALISGITQGFTKSAGSGFLLGCGAGIGGELGDWARYGKSSVHVSYKDATVQCLGAGLASYAGVKLYPNKIVWEVKF